MKILSLSEFVPAEICDTVRFTGYAGERNIEHFCGYASDYISQVLNDNSVDGAVYPKSCDSTRIIPSYLEGLAKFQYQLNVPSRCDEYAIEYYARQLKEFRNAVENYYSVDLGDVKIRAGLVIERNKLVAKQYARLADISYKDYIDAVHTDMQESLLGSRHIRLKAELRKKKSFKHRVYLVGSFLSNTNITEIIENVGLGIVGDNLPESGRNQGRIVECIGGDAYKAIATSVLMKRLSPTQNDFEKILEMDLAEIKSLQVEGVIYISQKYCESYDYLYSVYKKRLDEMHIPMLHLSLLDSQDEKKVMLLVEAFADML